MTFKDSFELSLAQRLASDGSGEAIVRWAGEQVLQSYKNGITAGQKGAKVIRQGESRRRSISGKAE
jgi:hypothetical protein